MTAAPLPGLSFGTPFRATHLLDLYWRGPAAFPEERDALADHFTRVEAAHAPRQSARYRAGFQERRGLRGPGDIRDLLVDHLDAIQQRYLTWSGERLAVRHDNFPEWQAVLPDLPLPVVVAWALSGHDGASCLYRAPGGLSHAQRAADIRTFCQRCIRPVARYDAMPEPVDPDIDALIRESGLDEIHLHLNNTTAATKVWLDGLRAPGHVGRTLREKGGWGWSREDQPLTAMAPPTPRTVGERLAAAARLRDLIAYYLWDPLACGDIPKAAITASLNPPPGSPWRARGGAVPLPRAADQHPAGFYWPSVAAERSVTQEVLLLAAALGRLRTAKAAQGLAHAVYCYGLLYMAHQQAAVQMRTAYGFDPFEEIVRSAIRDQSEEAYDFRFHQLAGGHPSVLRTVEGRFALTQTTRPKLQERLQAIFRGYDRARKRRQATRDSPGDGDRLNLTLVAHFVKQEDSDDPSEGPVFVDDTSRRRGCRRRGGLPAPYRHYRFRHSLGRQADVLLAELRDNTTFRQRFGGIDAANSEFKAEPHVFAPVFRYLAYHGYPAWTFHAGEDFNHLLGGIRAVAETYTHLPAHPGARIGHALAIGIDPADWLARTHGEVVLPVQTWLDDLVALWDVMVADGLYPERIPRLEADIQHWAGYLYQESVHVAALARAWRERHLDPHYLMPRACPHGDPDTPPRRRWAAREWRRVRAFAQQDTEAARFLRLFHDPYYRRRGQHRAHVRPDWLDAELLRAYQNAVARRVRDTGLAVEALPSSNLRIGPYEHAAAYHVVRWLGLSEHAGDVCLPVCLGADDPGVFATTLPNEYKLISRILTDRGDAWQARRAIDRIHQTAARYRFAPHAHLDTEAARHAQRKERLRRERHPLRCRNRS